MARLEEIVNSLFNFRSAISDNLVFKLHYRCTVLILVVFSFVITCRLVLGHSFSCYGSGGGGSNTFMETYCYAHETIIVASSFGKDVGKEILYPGIDRSTPDDINISIKFYSWVNLVFLVQAFNFYLPHLLWKFYEQGLMSRLTSGLDTLVADEDKKNLRLCILAKYLAATQGKHIVYTCVYVFCEFLNYVIGVLQIVWLLYFFQVTGVSSKVENVPMDTWNDFSNYYFPLISKCSMFIYRPSGALQKHDAMCTLPLNRLYMYMFLFLYAWYIFLAVLSGAVLMYRLVLIIPPLRYIILSIRAPLADKDTVSLISTRSSVFDWFFLSRFQKNLLPTDFQELLSKMGAVSLCTSPVTKYQTFEQSDNL